MVDDWIDESKFDVKAKWRRQIDDLCRRINECYEVGLMQRNCLVKGVLQTCTGDQGLERAIGMGSSVDEE